jgi:hypothetical protein
MRKTMKALALTICATALCGALAGCETDKAMGIDEYPGRTVYVYSPDGTLLDKGAYEGGSWSCNRPVISVKLNGKKYTTSWANVVFVEE